MEQYIGGAESGRLQQTQADWSRLQQTQADPPGSERHRVVCHRGRLEQTQADRSRLRQTGADWGSEWHIIVCISRRDRGAITPSHCISLRVTRYTCTSLRATADHSPYMHLSLRHSIPYFLIFFIRGILSQRDTQRCIISICIYAVYTVIDVYSSDFVTGEKSK